MHNRLPWPQHYVPCVRVHGPLSFQPFGFWTGVGSLVDLGGVGDQPHLGAHEVKIRTFFDDSLALNQDWAFSLPEETERLRMGGLRMDRQMSLNFGTSLSGK